MAKKILIKDIANKVGVSNATVSLVLNGKEKGGRVSTELARKIRTVAHEMNYNPNVMARSLRLGQSHTIGLIVADITNPFFANLAFNIQEYAESLNYTVLITNTNESVQKIEKAIHILKAHQVDGYIIVPTEFGESAIRDLKANHIPIVLVDRFFPDIEVSYVSVNNYQVSKKITQHLINKGCKRIAMLNYDTTLVHMQDRSRGYVDALKEVNIYDESLIKQIHHGNVANEVNTAIDSLLEREKRIDGVFFATNTLSTLGLKQLMQKNITIQKEIHVACFDKSEIFDFLNINIPYVNQPINDMAVKAVDLLLEQIKKTNNVPTKLELYAIIKD